MSWIYENFGDPDKCEKCGRIRNVQWVSKSRALLNDRTDWIALCKLCKENFRKVNTNFAPEIESVKDKIRLDKEAVSDLDKILVNKRAELDQIEKKLSLAEHIYSSKSVEYLEEESRKRELLKELEMFIEKTRRDINDSIDELVYLSERINTLKDIANNADDTSKKSLELLKEYNQKTRESRLELDSIERIIKSSKKKYEKMVEEMSVMDSQKKSFEDREKRIAIRERQIRRMFKDKGINIIKL